MDERILDAAKIAQNRDDIAFFGMLNIFDEKVLEHIELNVDLYEAIGHGNVQRAKELLDAGAKIDETVNELYSPETPLVRAVKSPGTCIELCQLLLDHGAKIDEYAQDGYTALMYAAMQGRMKTCKFLLNQGANILARDKYSNNTAPLLVAKKYTFSRKFPRKKPIGALQFNAPDPIFIDHLNDLKMTARFLVAYQEKQEKRMLTLLLCLRNSEHAAIREIYRQKLLIPHLKQFWLKPLLEAKNNDGTCLNDYYDV